MVAYVVFGGDARQPRPLARRQARRDFAGGALAVVSVAFAVLLTAAQARAEPVARSGDGQNTSPTHYAGPSSSYR